MDLSNNCLKSLTGLSLAAGFMLGDPTGTASGAILGVLGKSAEFFIDYQAAQRKSLHNIEAKVQKRIKKCYNEWLKTSKSEGRTDADIEAALINIPLALQQANITTKDLILDMDKFCKLILIRLPEDSIYKNSDTLKDMFFRLISSVRDVAIFDKDLKPEFDEHRFQKIIGEFDAAQADRNKKHQEQINLHQKTNEFLAREKGIPLENLKPLFELVKREFPKITDSDLYEKVSKMVMDVLASANKEIGKSNYGVEVTAALQMAQEYLKQLDVEKALNILADSRREQQELRKHNARGEAQLVERQAIIYKNIRKWDEAIFAYKEAAALDDEDAWHYFEIGDIYLRRGNLTLALENYQNGQNIANKIHNQRDLSVSHIKIGDVMMHQGRSDDALNQYKICLSVRTDFAEKTPNCSSVRDLSVSCERVADVLFQQGKLDESLTYSEANITTRIKLVELEPTISSLKFDLSVSYSKIAHVSKELGYLKKAVFQSEKGRSIMEDLVKHDPKNTEFQRYLVNSHLTTAEILDKQEEFDDALISYQKGRVAAESLLKSDPENMYLEHSLTVIFEGLAYVLFQQGEETKACEYFRSSYLRLNRIVRHDPNNMVFQRQLTRCCWKLAILEPKKEIQYCETALKIIEEIQTLGLLEPLDKRTKLELEKILSEARTKT